MKETKQIQASKRLANVDMHTDYVQVKENEIAKVKDDELKEVEQYHRDIEQAKQFKIDPLDKDTIEV